MENEAKKASKVWLVPTIIAAVLLVALIAFMLILGKGTKAVSDGTQTLAESVAPLKDGTAQLSDGVDQYTEGVDTIHKAMPTLTDGIQQYTEGVDTLNGYMKTLNSAAPALASGVQQLSDGAAQLDSYYDDMNSIADTVAATLNKVRTEVNGNASYQLLLTGAQGVADQLDVSKGTFAKGVVGMDTIIDNVDNAAASLADLNKNADLLGQLFVGAAGAENMQQSTFADLAVAGGLSDAQVQALSPLYAGWLAYNGGDSYKATLTLPAIAAQCYQKAGGDQVAAATAYAQLSGQDVSTFATQLAAYQAAQSNAKGYIYGLAVAGNTVHTNLHTATKDTANMKPVDIADATVAALTQNKKDPMQNIHTAASQVSAGIPQVIDTICSNLENGAAEQVDTGNPKSLKSQLKAYTEGVRTLNGGLQTLNSSVNGKNGLVSSVAQLYKDGSAKLAENSQALRDGVKQLADGAKQLSENSKALRDGASQLKDAAPALIDGIGQLKDGAKQVNGFTPVH